jgi:lipid-A-disaccharide synthase
MVAGEASGDLHGAAVVRALKRLAPAADIAGVGGDMMAGEGMRLIHHIKRLAFMGFIEVVRNLPAIRALERLLLREVETRRPDVVVLIDYPGFNLRFARKAKERGVPVLYYISPQVWAWNKGRVRRMAGPVDRMKVVFPFEVGIYRKEGIDVEWVGHPLAEHLAENLTRAEFVQQQGLDPGKKIVGLFPGSRTQEIERILPVMVRAAEEIRRTREVQIALGVAPNLGPALIRRHLPAGADIRLVEGATHGLMAHADAAIVTSGTATLETGWFGTPMVVVYRTSPVTYLIGRMLVRVPAIGLVNIVAGKKIVPEFVQHAMTVENLTAAVGRILDDPAYAEGMRRDLAAIRDLLGPRGASEKVARGILALAEGR